MALNSGNVMVYSFLWLMQDFLSSTVGPVGSGVCISGWGACQEIASLNEVEQVGFSVLPGDCKLNP